MICIEDKTKCCGCSACVQRCPGQCIEMTTDFEGFGYPKVDGKRCMNCGLCERVCPILNHMDEQNDGPLKTYIAYAKDEDLRLSSSSGGMFTNFAEDVLQKGGMVFGAAFDSNFMVHHIGVADQKEIGKLRGSKYLQSRIENTYRDVEATLKTNVPVLFTGTACQVAGLKSFLRKDYSNLITVDVLCHGVPSPVVWKKYLETVKKAHGSALRRISSRCKNYGWKKFSVLLEFSNNTEYLRTFTEDPYMRLFLTNVCLRPSCYACKFKGMGRPSDVTIGDCWGVEQHSPEMDDDKGISVVIIHTEAGIELYQAIRPGLIEKECELNTTLPQSADSRKSVPPHPGRYGFFPYLRFFGFRRSVNYIKPTLLHRILWKISRVIGKKWNC